jgi:transcriptional regulator with XRE-family HTH domain
MVGKKIRELREQNHILLRHLAGQLDIDTAMLSKMERGDRFFKKDDILALAKIFGQPEEYLLTLWLAEKILKTIQEETYKQQALELALKTINPS